MEFNPYIVFKSKTISVSEILKFHFEDIAKEIKRKISSRITIRNPWQILISHKIHKDLFFEWYRAVRDYIPSLGVTTSVKRNKRNILTSITITFVRRGTFKFHFNQALSGNSITNYLTKSIGTCTGNVIVLQDKPVTIIYNMVKGNMKIVLNYQVTNRYGNIVL